MGSDGAPMSLVLVIIFMVELKASVGEKIVLNILAKFAVKHLHQTLLFSKVTSLGSVTLLTERLRHRCFPVNFAKFSRTPFS